MKMHVLTLSLALVAAAAVSTGCGRQTRGNADAYNSSRAGTPAEGGATSRQGSAGDSKHFGDRDAKKEYDQASPSGRSMDKRSTSGPGSMERQDVTIQTGGTQK